VLRRLDQAYGRLSESVTPERMDEPVEVRWGTEWPISDRRAIELVLDRLLMQSVQQLGARNEGIRQFVFELRNSSGKSANGRDPVQCQIDLVRPTLDIKRLSELVRLQLDRLQLAIDVGEVILRATLTAPLEESQCNLLGESHRDHRRGIDSLLNSLSTRLGPEHVLRAELCSDYQPECAVAYRPWIDSENGRDARRVPQVAESVKRRCHPHPRPLRLLPRPLPVAVWSVVPDGPPLRVRWRGEERRIVRADGPERIETGWWRTASIGRDYYRVETERGHRLWLFRSLSDGAWFVQGEF
jgi:protein ImuB